jgi:hypothetical protein
VYSHAPLEPEELELLRQAVREHRVAGEQQQGQEHRGKRGQPPMHQQQQLQQTRQERQVPFNSLQLKQGHGLNGVASPTGASVGAASAQGAGSFAGGEDGQYASASEIEEF